MSRLLVPVRRFARESAWLSEQFAASAAVRDDASRLACEMVVVRLHDCWARCCRDLVIGSASGGTSTLTGTPLKRSPLVTGGERAVIPALMNTYPRKRRNEPNWFSSAECIDAAKRLKVQNLTTIAAGLGATTSPADAVRRVRNFYAHRGERTALVARGLGVFVNYQAPNVFALAEVARPGLSHLDAWIVDLRNTLRAAAE